MKWHRNNLTFHLTPTETGLTYEALKGKNKHSVPDCEKIISLGVIGFMEKNKHLEETKVLKTIHNWHKAVAIDGRGLDETTQSNHCKDMLQWVLEDWMPYLDKEQSDYSLLDVNRSVQLYQLNTPFTNTAVSLCFNLLAIK